MFPPRWALNFPQQDDGWSLPALGLGVCQEHAIFPCPYCSLSGFKQQNSSCERFRSSKDPKGASSLSVETLEALGKSVHDNYLQRLSEATTFSVSSPGTLTSVVFSVAFTSCDVTCFFWETAGSGCRAKPSTERRHEFLHVFEAVQCTSFLPRFLRHTGGCIV